MLSCQLPQPPAPLSCACPLQLICQVGLTKLPEESEEGMAECG